MMKCSSRVLGLNQSPIRKLMSYVEDVENKGIKVYPLNMGQPDIDTPKEFLKAIKDYNTKTLSYSNSRGMLELRKAISDYYKRYNVDFIEDEILVTNGGSEAIQLSLMATCDINDNILIIEPFYTNYKTIANSLNINVKAITCDSNFNLPTDELLDSYVDENTKAILLSNPNNPTGKVYTKKEVLSLCRLAIKHNLWIISDEVYREFIYDDIEFNSFADIKEVSDRVIILDSISKKYSCCGARIGSISSKNQDIILNILKLCQSRLCVPTLEQIGAISLYNLPLTYFSKINEIYKNRRNVLCNELDNIDDIRYIKSNGAFYVIVELPIKNADDFAKWVLTEFNYNNETINICPAKDFYIDKEKGLNEIRISYTLNEVDLIKSVNVLKKALKEYKLLKKY